MERVAAGRAPMKRRQSKGRYRRTTRTPVLGSAAAAKRAAPAPEPVRPSRIDLTTPPLPPAVSKPKILAAHLLTFCWTALIRVLTMLDRLAPAPIQARKTLLGRIGIGVGALATLGLFWLAYSRFGK